MALKARWNGEYAAWKNGLSRKGWVQFRRACRKRARGRAPRDVDTGEPIPRVLSGYNLFVKETYKKIREENPTADRKEHFRLTIQAWNSLHESEKAVSPEICCVSAVNKHTMGLLKLQVWQARHAELLPQNLEAREKAKEKRLAEFRARHPKIQL